MIFSLSFAVALTGAVAPGPLLTYTIVKTMGTRRQGFLVGFWVIAGHALLESVLVIAILLGFAAILKRPPAAKIIGVIGGFVLLYFGVNLIRDVFARRLPDVFAGSEEADRGASRFVNTPPVLGGILISMSNPYWWIWWATIGFAFMHNYGISFLSVPSLLAFILGHEAGDLVWYVFVSTVIYFGRQRLNARVYHGLLVVCGLVMMGFGVYLGLSPFVS